MPESAPIAVSTRTKRKLKVFTSFSRVVSSRSLCVNLPVQNVDAGREIERFGIGFLAVRAGQPAGRP
jgi:hypothetical protein